MRISNAVFFFGALFACGDKATEPSVESLLRTTLQGTSHESSVAATTLRMRCCAAKPGNAEACSATESAIHEIKVDSETLFGLLSDWRPACLDRLSNVVDERLLALRLSDPTRGVAIDALTLVPPTSRIVTLLVSQLRSTDATIRKQAVNALADFGEDDLEPVVALLQHEPPGLMLDALDSLFFAFARHPIDMPTLDAAAVGRPFGSNLHGASSVDDDIQATAAIGDVELARMLGVRRAFCRSARAESELTRLEASKKELVVYEASIARRLRNERCRTSR